MTDKTSFPFKKGERVRLIKPLAGWENFELGTILGSHKGEGYGSEPAREQAWSVRWDNYDYGVHKDNCHHVAESCIKSDEPTEAEILALFGIIK